MDKSFKGLYWRLANNWYSTINVNNYINKPINYLEIGAFYGANIISVADSYALHKDSKIYCIDPWKDYDDYSEFKNKIENIYDIFLNNIEKIKDKVIINRGFSNNEIIKFKDEIFDIIYIDGNHEPNYVLEDAILSFRKLKKGGIMIFDDYGWDEVKKGVDAFLSAYYKKIIYLGLVDDQIFIKKIN